MSKLNLKVLNRVLLPLIFSSFVASCGSEFNPNEFSQIQTQLPQVEIQSNNSVKIQVEHGVYAGVVTKLLPDDTKGLKHQHFLVKITSSEYFGAIIKIAHDVDYAPPVPVKPGSIVEIKGDLITNVVPMVLHWTHRAYNESSHPDGTLN